MKLPFSVVPPFTHLFISISTNLRFGKAGIWALIVLLRQRLDQRSPNRRVRLPRFCEFTLKPSIALSAFGFLFVAVIAGSLLTQPTAVTAEKRDARDKQMMTGFQNPSNEPVFKTAQQIGGDGITQIGSPVFDSSGNRYVRGGFTGTITFETTPQATTLTASRDFDGFVAKYDRNGIPVWVRQASGATSGIPATLAVEGATALAVDSTGNVYIGGSFVKTIVLQGGANPNVTLADNGAAGVNYESFIAKYNANGNLLWAKGGNSGSPKNADNLEIGQNAINQIVIDASGNLYVSGLVSGNRFFGTTFTNNGETEILLAKLNSADGAVVWTKIIGGAADDNALDLKIDNSNNLYLIGNFGSPTVTFPTTPATTLSNPDNEESATDTFIAKFNSTGANLWVKSLGNDEVVGGSQIAVTGAGEIYLTGYFFDSATFPTVPQTVLIETEGGSQDEEEASLGGYLTKIDTSGNFVWAKGFGGLGEAVALDAMGRIYIVGTFWDGGTFGLGEANEESLASFGGEDLYVARYDSNGNFDFAKPIAATGLEGLIAIGNPTGDGATENNYNPLGIAFNPLSGTMFVAGEFQNAIALDCITLTTPSSSVIQSYIAEISDDAGTCRIWNGLDANDNNFDSPDNWNGGVLPSVNDSVYVPYTGNNNDAPTYNPANNIPLNNVTVADDRILTLEKNLTVNNRLDLLGGFIDADNFTVSLSAFAETLSVSEGRVLGRVQKQFFSGDSFTFPVGTENGYSPVTLSNINAGKGGSFTVTANQGAYPNTATDLPTNRAARWWNLTNGGLVKADLTFKYLAGDITNGTESSYRAYRIPTGGGAATLVNSTINTSAQTVTAPNVSQFSDWTIAQPAAPTAAAVSVEGRVTNAAGRAVAQAFVVLTDRNGATRTVLTNSFGYYRFADVAAGQTYVVAVRHKRYEFAPQVVSVTENLNNLNFAAQ